MPEVDEMVYLRNHSVAEVKEHALPAPAPQPDINNRPNAAEPSALQHLAAIAAIVAAQDQEMDDEDDVNYDTEIVSYCGRGIPFRMLIAATPAAIGGEAMVDAADEAMRRVLAQRMANAQ